MKWHSEWLPQSIASITNTSLEAPDLQVDALKISLSAQRFIIKALSCNGTSSPEVVAEVEGEATTMNSTTEAKARSVAELVHAVISGSEPHFTLISVL